MTTDKERSRLRRLDPNFKEADRAAAKNYRETHREEIREKSVRRSRAKQAWLNSLKSGPCIECGEYFPPCCMDFDHVRGSKTKCIGSLLNCSEAVILAEIAKCDLVCNCCHRVRTQSRVTKARVPVRARFYAKTDALKTAPCSDCHRFFPPVAMDFDHVLGDKADTISQMHTKPWEAVLEEIAKCELVCANCHRIRTNARRILKDVREAKQQVPSPSGMKACSKCGVPKLLGDFHRNVEAKDGRRPECKVCHNIARSRCPKGRPQ